MGTHGAIKTASYPLYAPWLQTEKLSVKTKGKEDRHARL